MNDPRQANAVSKAHLILASLFLAGALALFGIVVFQVSSSESAVVDASLSLADKRAQEQALESAVRVASETKTQRSALQNLVIPKGGSGAFIASVESLAAEAGVSSSVFSVDAQAPRGDTPGTLTLSVQYSGSYAGGVRFLRLVETMPASVSVSSFSLGYSTVSKKWEGTFQFSALSYDSP